MNEAKIKEKPFWQHKTLAEMSSEEWESLCDGCGLCCLHKFVDENEDYLFTDIACRLLDVETCRCTHYPTRFQHVPDCLPILPNHIREYDWLPTTCAYRRLAAGLDLPHWHPLISGNSASVHDAGVSAKGRCISENKVTDIFENHIVTWITNHFTKED